MKEKVIGLAIALPHAYPWEKHNLDEDQEEIDKILKECDIHTIEKRRVAKWNIDRLIYLATTNSRSKEEIKTKIIEEIKDEKYQNEYVINEILRGRRLSDDTEITIYKNFIKNNLTIRQKQDNKKNIIIWLVDLVVFHEIEKNNNLNTDVIIKLVKEIVDNNFSELQYTEGKIIECLKTRGLWNKKNIDLFNKEFINKCNGFSELLSKFMSAEQNANGSDNESTEKVTDSILDLLLDDMDDFQIMEECDSPKSLKEKVEVANIKEKSIEAKNNLQKDKIQNKSYSPKANEDLVGKNLRALCQSLGYKLIKNTDKRAEEDDLGILKELALLKNGAVLSQLYNIYTNINNITIENIEAGLADFFETLKLQGLEVDDTKNVGEEIEVNTDDVLKKYVFSEATEKRGTVTGKIEYLQWNYKGKSVVPMIIKPNK